MSPYIYDSYSWRVSYRIEISTAARTLTLYKDGQWFKSYPVAVGAPATPTPLGNWTITKKALWGEQFGGHFMQLSVPWGIYGIHGTNKPWSIGQPWVKFGMCLDMLRGLFRSTRIWSLEVGS